MDKDLIEKIVIRPPREGDVGFLFSTWATGLYYGNDNPGDDEHDARKKMSKIRKDIEPILYSPKTRIAVACLKEDEDVILGYSVFEGDSFHWIYVKKPWRLLGIGKSLIPPGIKKATFMTEAGKSLKPNNWEYIPFNERRINGKRKTNGERREGPGHLRENAGIRSER